MRRTYRFVMRTQEMEEFYLFVVTEDDNFIPYIPHGMQEIEQVVYDRVLTKEEMREMEDSRVPSYLPQNL